MVRLSWRLMSVLALTSTLAAAGCSKSALPKTYPAGGTAVFEGGEPLKGGSIVFLSTGAPNAGVVAEILSDGSFKLRTIKDNERADGAPEGEYHVIVRPPLPPGAKLMDAHRGMPEIKLTKTYKVEPTENIFKLEVPAQP
jgi:hypothetical protein